MRTSVHFLLWAAGLARAETQTTAAERAAVARHAAGQGWVVEVGAWHGVTTAELRAAVGRGGRLWAVDPYVPGRLRVSLQRLIALREVGKARGAEVTWIRKTGVEAAAEAARTGRQVDLVFIDGDHSWEGVSGDWNAWSPLVRVGGHVALHDSRSTPTRDLEQAGSARFTRDVVRHAPGWRVVEEVDSLTVVQRVAA
ncbi:MAG: hypothetical protein RL653_3268 [Pseudomonadota bacterium]|jgi:hypothetical protein